jgi:hypothetical protein
LDEAKTSRDDRQWRPRDYLRKPHECPDIELYYDSHDSKQDYEKDYKEPLGIDKYRNQFLGTFGDKNSYEYCNY